MSLYDRAMARPDIGDEASQVAQVNQVIAPLGAGLLVMFVGAVAYMLYKPIQRRATYENASAAGMKYFAAKDRGDIAAMKAWSRKYVH